MEKEKDWVSEQEHFHMCHKLIEKNIILYEKQAEEFRVETETLFKEVQSGNVELYNQLIVSTGLQEHAKGQLKKNQTAIIQPYFGRVDYKNLSQEKQEKIYIGKNGVFRNKTDVVIADWRSPIATVYYENELGEGSYKLPSGQLMEIDLKLKRTYDISKGILNGYYDSDVASNDELLVKYLSKNKDIILGDIIATIQKEQNEIIRATPYGNVIVQGVAGSGKTTVAMHRISYILYNFQDRFTSNEFCIIGSNDILISYITTGLPELDVYDVKQKRMDNMFLHLLGKEWKKDYRVAEVDSSGRWKSKLGFMLSLERFLQKRREEIVPEKGVTDSDLGLLLSRNNIATTIRDNGEYSLRRLLSLLDERIKTKIRFAIDLEDKEFYREKTREYRKYFTNSVKILGVTEIYHRFLIQYGIKNQLDINEALGKIEKNQYDVYDLAALCLIRKRITEKMEDEEFGQIFVDEAQDFGVSVYYALRKALPKCYFTIMGDVSQNIHYETGMNDWEDMITDVFNQSKDSFKILAKSYRNTIEISQFAEKILKKASLGRYRIEPVIRHGMPVQIISLDEKDDIYQHIARLIEDIKKREYDTIAVICSDRLQAKTVEDNLSQYVSVDNGEKSGFSKGVMVLPIELTKGLEFDTVILFNPDLNEETMSPAQAKLLYVAITRALHELHIFQH